jgi:hypothetical protein
VFSAKYSQIASESQTSVPLSSRQGTLQVGEKLMNGETSPWSENGVMISSNAMPFSRIKIHGRKDQDE